MYFTEAHRWYKHTLTQKQSLSLSVQSGSLAPSTPLTGRVYLKEKDLLVTPVSSATQSVSRLQSMVAGLRTAPSDQLLQTFKSVPVFVCFPCLYLICLFQSSNEEYVGPGSSSAMRTGRRE